MSKNLISKMKERIAQAGASKREIMYFKPDSVQRVRFLTELDAGISIEMHNKFGQTLASSIFAPCMDPEDHEDCKYCKEEIPTQEWYAWSVWDYDNSCVRIIFQKATGISPVPSLIEMYEEYGTIKDRDYKIKKVGKGTGGSFAITPLDKSKFGIKKAKPYSEEEIKDIINEAYSSSKPIDDDDDDEDEDDYEPKRKKNKKTKKQKSLRSKFEELDFDELKDIAKELGMSKKEIKNFDDEEEIIDELFDNYEEDDLQDCYDGLQDEDEDDD